MPTPNIVLIFADDMGYGDLSCLNDASRIDTPHMDRVAREGMVFTDAHAASSVCTPSRYALLTGRYAWRGRLKRGVLGPYEGPLIEEELLTLPQLLRDAGYHTACIGKWHLGMRWPFRGRWAPSALLSWSAPDDARAIVEMGADVDYTQPIRDGPTAYGFDHYFGVDVPNFPPYCFIEDDRTAGIPTVPKPDEMYGVAGPMREGWRLEAIMPALAERAVSCIAERARHERPFFLYLPLTAPHTPIVPTEAFLGRSGAGIYGDWVMQVDDTVGQVHAALERHGLGEDTLLIVTSDNGSPGRDGHHARPGTVLEAYGHNPSWILRGMKGDTWDGGHREPLLARWPARIRPGSQCAQLVCLTDVMATCARIVGRALPAGAAQDSLDVLPYLTGAHADLDPPIRTDVVHHGLRGLYGVRKGPWKLIAGQGSGGFSPDPVCPKYDPPGQLYNLAQDIGEQHNLYDDHPEVVYELSALLARRRHEAVVRGQQVRRPRVLDE